MLSELLQPQRKLDAGRMVEEVVSCSQPSSSEESALEGVSVDENTDEIFAEQALAEEEKFTDEVSTIYGYGYGWKRHGVLLKFQEDVGELFDLKQPDVVPIEERIELCRDFDKQHFKQEHYLADLFEPDEQFLASMNFEIDAKTLAFNDLDREQLKNLQIRQLDGFGLKAVQQQISYSLLDLVCAYLYDLRTTDGEHSVESGWTIKKLSPSLSFLVQWPDVGAAVVGFLRRSLVFPIYRNWRLSLKVLDDVELVLETGRVAVLKCLLEIRRIFNSSSGDCYYLFNQLFLDDFCLWIQSADELIIDNLKDRLKLARKKVEKECLGFDLDCLELEAGLQLLNVDNQKKIEVLDSDDEDDLDNA